MERKRKAGTAKCHDCGIKHDGQRGWKYTPELGLVCPIHARAHGIDPDQAGIKQTTKGSIESYGI